MNVLRTLLSVGIEDDKSESVDLAPNIQPFNPHKSAQILPRAPRLLRRKSAATPFSHSSINLNNIPKSIRRNIDNTTATSTQTIDDEIHISLATAPNSHINLTLVSDADLSRFQHMRLETDQSLMDIDMDHMQLECQYPPIQIGYHDYALDIASSSLHSITSSYSQLHDASFSDFSSCNPLYTMSDLLYTKYECKDDDIRSVGEDVELPIFHAADFKELYQIGYGAFGIVNKSFDLKSCQIVALKQCRSTNNIAMKSFKKEIQICNEFKDCPHIINMVEYGISDKISIALEYMNMCSLNKNYRVILKKNTINRIKHICVSVLSALNALHSKLYVHNDIKPGNILLNDAGDVKLSDFGCIKQMKDSETPLTTHCGTEFYQSYEKRFVSPIVYDTKSDIYSFGITICEVLDFGTINKNQAIPFRIPQNIIDKFSRNNPDLLDFLHKCLEKEAKQRWDATQLLAHPFLASYKRETVMIEAMQDMDDLEFMVDALIEYYSNYKHEPIVSTSVADAALSAFTPMDHMWSDSQRIQNIAQFSGCCADFVQDFICQRVKNVRDKYLKL